ncbi:MAG TPA: acetylornithine deacetylase [Burkholderiales bacterium]|jgi:acetylornithine deacetylase|nr:acetylornithine deacetylase [Burkholderiales bacterium]
MIKADTWELIQRLVGFDTTSRDSNLGLIEWVRDWLGGFGVESRLTYDESGKKANLFATIQKGTRPGIVLSGHSDVVPVDGQPWDTDPFKATLKDDRIYGRGSADMKSYLACALAMTPRFLAADLKCPVHLALSYDEELGCMGVRGLIADLAQAGVRPAGCIIGEPTSMQPVVAHKGKRAYKCCFRGREAHSALTPQGVNAIEYAAKLVVYIRHMAERMRDCEQRDNGFDVPFTTLQTGVIKGGTASNIVPRDCEVHFEFRYLPGADPEALEAEIKAYAERVLLPEMRAVDPETFISFETKAEIPGLDPSVERAEQDRVTSLAQALARNQSVAKVAYATEAGLFQRAGIPSIICGPGSIEQAHKPNEFIALEQVALCESFMERLLAELAR